jgi:hypothetical protein
MSYRKSTTGIYLCSLVTGITVALGADLWQSRPFPEWTAKDTQKILTASPWARQAVISTGLAGGPSHGSDRRGSSIYDNPAVMRPPDQAQDAAGGATRQLGGNAGDEERQPAAASVKLTVQWRSALPIKQALARAKFGVEVATSPEAREFLDAYEPVYVIAVLGIPKSMLPSGDVAKKSLVDRTILIIGGAATPPSDIQFRMSGSDVDTFFVFPRSPTAPAAKEAEFSIRLTPLKLKERFHLSDMLFKGKLEM